VATAAAAVACLALVGVPVGLALAGGGTAQRAGPPSHAKTVGESEAQHRVVAALGATVDSGNFAVTYSFAETSSCSGSATGGGPRTPTACAQGPEMASGITGHGVIDTDPFAMVTVSEVPGLGEVTASDNGTDVWEEGGADYGHSGSAAPGTPMSGFAGLVEGSLGKQEGALAMQGLASPTGYLSLDQQDITAGTASEVGTSGGLAVYRITDHQPQFPTAAGLTPQESATIKEANALLEQVGYTATTIEVSIDASGYIRETDTVTSFSDGVKVTAIASLSDFGCAGTALMPGQAGTPTPPAGCTSPDTGATTPTSPSATAVTTPPSTTPTTTAPDTATTTASAPTTSVVVPGATTTTTQQGAPATTVGATTTTVARASS
jgi:hypothetical protein